MRKNIGKNAFSNVRNNQNGKKVCLGENAYLKAYDNVKSAKIGHFYLYFINFYMFL